MMFLTPLEQHLGLLEAQFNAVSSALIAADPAEVHSGCTKLQQLTVEFLQMLDEYGRKSLDTPQVVLRIQALGQGMPIVRESLLRRSAYVERALALLVPQAAQPSTYSDSSSPYGNGARTSGQFKTFAA